MQSIRTALHAARVAAAVALALLALPVCAVRVAAEPSYPVYCQGPLDAFNTSSGPFWYWAAKPAKEAAPPTFSCAWPDRLPRGKEIHPGYIGGVQSQIGLLCTVRSPSFAQLDQYGQGKFFSIQVEAKPGTSNDGSPCLTPTSAPVLVTPEDRPWPVAKDPGSGPKMAPQH
jgi:hypothetical protein